MFHDFDFQRVLAASSRAPWQIDDVIAPGAALDFARPLMPESFARTGAVTGLSAAERRTLNQIRGHEYLGVFGLVEEFILPFVLDHARPQLRRDDHQVRALLQFASEEAKHIHLFKRFHAAFCAGFATPCPMIGAGEALAAEVLRHDSLAVALIILQVEWMTQRHYVDSVRDDDLLEPLFKSLLRYHWIEEAQHAKLDTLIVEALAAERTKSAIDAAIDEYFEIAAFLDSGFKAQTELNLGAFERAIGRTLEVEARAQFLASQHQAARWTYIGSGLTHPRFRATMGAISRDGLTRIDAAAPGFC